MTAKASRGDIYLDETIRTAIALGGGKIGCFTGSETGGIDRTPGDQIGRGSCIQDHYRGSWDGVFHYNVKADEGKAAVSSGSGAPFGDVSEFAARVIAGGFGNNEVRCEALGSRYDEVRTEANWILLATLSCLPQRHGRLGKARESGRVW